MKPVRVLRGDMGRWDTPDWAALEALLGLELCSHFMWMFDVKLEDGTRLNAYKHRWTRCHFHLSGDGRAFYYTGDGRYCEVDPYDAIVAVFADWAVCHPTAEEEAALQAALRKARTTPRRRRDRARRVR